MFDPLLLQMKAIYTRPDESSDFAGALLRPMADGVKEMVKAGETRLVEEFSGLPEKQAASSRKRA